MNVKKELFVIWHHLILLLCYYIDFRFITTYFLLSLLYKPNPNI